MLFIELIERSELNEYFQPFSSITIIRMLDPSLCVEVEVEDRGKEIFVRLSINRANTNEEDNNNITKVTRL